MTADVGELRAELERVGASYGTAGAARYIALYDTGDGQVWLKGQPRSGLNWRGRRDRALELLRQVEGDAGPDGVWRALDGRLEGE